MQQLSPRELASWLSDTARATPLVVDVREAWEVQRGIIAGAQHIPMAAIPAAAPRLPKSEPIVIYCQHGVRSLRVAGYLQSQGCAQVFNLSGGISAWHQDVGAPLAAATH